MADWETLDVVELLQRRDEATGGGTTSGNVGSYQVPIGQPLRRQFPLTPYKNVDDHAEAESANFADPDYEWAKNMVR